MTEARADLHGQGMGWVGQEALRTDLLSARFSAPYISPSIEIELHSLALEGPLRFNSPQAHCPLVFGSMTNEKLHVLTSHASVRASFVPCSGSCRLIMHQRYERNELIPWSVTALLARPLHDRRLEHGGK
jgi:hypothetical protein